MSELVVMCIDCDAEFVAADGWLDRCAECCLVLDEHLSGMHVDVQAVCVSCASSSDGPGRRIRAA
ncbi:hypothetical protein FE697_002570 [Mumia zhuanghuii]|uniref:Uncharacterized protein n=2 Tax=Mumia TaxID=1546255 RepID=A0ABW1QJ00_9ACTN|nr:MULTISPECIES: hypothetical protein [Mumia]KAA1424816.1 hypothetical protein FE697_002570 [Mumia zhuanghuii]